MEFELPKINVSFEYDEEKDEIVLVINGVEKRVKTEDMITEMEKLQEQNTALEQEPCEDCISRRAVLDGIDAYIEKVQSTGAKDDFISFEELVVKALPPVTPKPKTGHWKKLNVGYGCSECSLATNESGVNFYRFCPNCGAKMESEE